MDSFEIPSETGLKLRFHSRHFDANHWLDFFSITMEGPSFSASAMVGNPPYGTSPMDLFSRIARASRPWEGTQEWDSMEGEFSLQATCDSLGHITLTALLNPRRLPPCWVGSISLLIDMGDSDSLLRNARAFFNELA